MRRQPPLEDGADCGSTGSCCAKITPEAAKRSTTGRKVIRVICSYLYVFLILLTWTSSACVSPTRKPLKMFRKINASLAGNHRDGGFRPPFGQADIFTMVLHACDPGPGTPGNPA